MEGEGRKIKVRAEPDEAVGPEIDLRQKVFLVALAGDAVDAVGGEQQIAIAQGLWILDQGFEAQLDAQLAGALLHDDQHLLARHAGEAVPGGAQHLALDVDVDVVPVLEAGADRLRGRRVGRLEAVHGGVREHHAEAERVVEPVLLVNRDGSVRERLLHQDREIQAPRPATQTIDLHVLSKSNSPQRHRDTE